MTYQHDPTTWHDGESLTAANSANRWEDGLENISNDLADLAAQVAALVAAAPGTGGKIAGGDTAARALVSPVLGAVFFDSDLGYPVYGTGTEWVQADGTAVAGAGGTNAPLNFQAEVVSGGTIGQINLTWTAPAAADGDDTYKLYETASLTGVSGATALTSTSTSRTPGTARSYTYWVTCSVDGVESAASNTATVSLPYVAPGTGGGGGSAGTPAELLDIGSTGGYWDLGVGYSSGHVNYPQTDLLGTTTGGVTFPPYFQLNPAADAVQFKIFTNGAVTSANTHYPRSELREYKSNGTTKAAWTVGTSGSHVMQYDVMVSHLPPNKPWTTAGQIHDADSDALSIKIKGDDTSDLDIVASIYGTDHATKLVSGYTLGDWHTIKVEVVNGSLKIYADSVLKITSSAMSGKGAGHYFKIGNYLQTADDWGGFESPTEYGLVEIRNLTVTHSPAL